MGFASRLISLPVRVRVRGRLYSVILSAISRVQIREMMCVRARYAHFIYHEVVNARDRNIVAEIRRRIGRRGENGDRSEIEIDTATRNRHRAVSRGPSERDQFPAKLTE